MTVARRELLGEDTSQFHCVSRCVRRAWLCGRDPYTGQDFEHRRAWVAERVRFLASVFAVDVCAYAVMSNHLHVVLNFDALRLDSWSQEEVVERHARLFRGAPAQLQGLDEEKRGLLVAAWRSRLGSVSWFMRCLNEHIARKANREDGTRGRFWEGRFRCQPLLDDAALLTCMAYVDLNPVRAGEATSLERAEHTSIAERLRAAKDVLSRQAERDEAAGREVMPKRRRATKVAQDSAGLRPSRALVPEGLAPFASQVPLRKRSPGDAFEPAPYAIPFTFMAYVELLDWVGRTNYGERGKGGTLRGDPPEVLAQFRLRPEKWLELMQAHGLSTATMLGSIEGLDRAAKARAKTHLKGQKLARAIYVEAAAA